MRTPLPPTARPTVNVYSRRPPSADIAESLASHLPVFAVRHVAALIAAVRDETIRQIADCRATQSAGPEVGYCATCGNHQRMDRHCAAKQMQEYPRPTVAFAVSLETSPGKTHTAAYLCERMSAPTLPPAMDLEEAIAAYEADSIAAELAEISQNSP